MKVIRLILTLILCNIALTSHAMLVRAAQPIAKRIASRLFTPKAPTQTPTIKHTLQLPARTVKMPQIKPTSSLNFLSTQSMKLFKTRPNYHRYYNNKPRWILSAALGIGALATSMLQDYASAESAPADQPKPWAAVEERYRKELIEEEDQIMNELFAALKITKEEWEKRKSETKELFVQYIDQEIEKHNKLDTFSSTKWVIDHVLKEQEIDPKSVCMVHDATENFMSVIGGVNTGKALLLVNEKRWAYMPSKVNDFGIAHEIQHLKYDDSLISVSIHKAIKASKSIDAKEAEKIFTKYRIFAEKRADILAALTNLDRAKAMADYTYTDWVSYPLVWMGSKIGLWSDGLRPDYITQSNYFAKIYQEMYTCSQTN